MATVRGLWVAVAVAGLAVAGCSGDEAAGPATEPAVATPTGAGPPEADSDDILPTPSTTPPSSVSPAVSSTTTTVPAESAGTLITGPVTLRGDGLGEARFGDPMSSVDPWLQEQFGPPRSTATALAPLAAVQPWEAEDGLYVATYSLGPAEGTNRGDANGGRLEVIFSDVGPGPDDGTLRLVGWETVRPGATPLASESGLRVGLRQRRLLADFPVTLEDSGVFEVGGARAGESGIRGRVDGGAVVELVAGATSRPPADIPAAPAPPEGPPVDGLPLRPDGIDGVDVGAPAARLVAELEERFGPPTEAATVVGSPGSIGGWAGYFPESSAQILTWFDPGIRIVVADGAVYGGSIPGQQRLVNWATTSGRLRLGSGVGVGSTVDDMNQAAGDVTFGRVDECAGVFRPDDFVIAARRGDVGGSIDWNWVAAVQDALNVRGASLEIDSVYGPVTREAVADFQAETGIATAQPWDSGGEIGPATLDALDVSPPADAPIVELFAGIEPSC